MKKIPTKEVEQQRKSILQSLKLNDYRDNPTDEILQKRLNKRKQRQRVLIGLENKYDFVDNNPTKQIKPSKYNMSNKSIGDLKKRFSKLRNIKIQLDNYSDSANANKIPTFKDEIQEIYHTIETEKMSGYDMYNMIHALQYQLRVHKQQTVQRKKENIKKTFDSLGGIQLYLKLKSYLTDIGVNIYELH